MDQKLALKRAVFWLMVLIEAAGVDVAETNFEVKADGEVLQTINLGEDLKAFEALGLDIHAVEGMEISEIEIS